MMTKKTKEAAVELEPVEVVELPKKHIVEEGLGFDDVPFAAPRRVLEARRPYLNDPKHEPIVEIAGKQFELKDVEVKDIPVDLGSVIPFYRDVDNIFENQSRRRNNGSGKWTFGQKLAHKDLKFKHLQIDGLNIYISTGSSLVISDTLYRDDYYGDTPFSRSGNKYSKPVLVIIASSITAKTLSFLGDTVLFNSTIESNNGITLTDSTVVHSSIQGPSQYLAVDDSTIENTRLFAANYISVTDSNVYGLGITGPASITLSRTMGGQDFILSTYGDGSKSLDFLSNNQYLHNFDFSGSFTPSLKDYTPVVDFPVHYGSNVITIDKRIDYGLFSAVKPVPFMRLNQCDLLVAGEVFSVKDFFPEYVTAEQSPKQPQPFAEYNPPMVFSSSLGSVHNRNSQIWKRTAKIAFNGNKAVIGKTGEIIVNNLLDQIKSRINLYVELNSVA